jgi:uncharacterized membrane protein HdeD (DUF308 family)
MLLAIIGLIDIIAGITLLFPNFLGFYLGVILLLKSLTSILGGLASKSLFILLGIIDLIAGLMLVLNFSLPWVWAILVLKGLYSFVIGLGSG